MSDFRTSMIIMLYEVSSSIYTRLFKRYQAAWGISKEDLLLFPEASLGYSLGIFYQENDFDIMPKLENHDVFHVVTNTNTAVEDEIAMQFLLLGNGKISFYLIGVVMIGSFFLPEYWGYYIRSFRKGKLMAPFHCLEFKEMLHESLADIQLRLCKKKSVYKIIKSY